MLQIVKSLEEAARVQGIGWMRRMYRIILPMSTSGLMAGMLLTFITAMRELSLIILLLTPHTMVMTGLIFGYHGPGSCIIPSRGVGVELRNAVCGAKLAVAVPGK